MPLLIGTDEAGYGPNLGPLVVGLSAWQVPAEIGEENLREALAAVVVDDVPAAGDLRVPIADSKALYQPSRGVGLLETAVLAIGRILGRNPRTWSEVAEQFTGSFSEECWDREFDFAVPLTAVEAKVNAWQEFLSAGLAEKQISLCAWSAKLVQPRDFNPRVRQLGSKGTLLSETTLTLIAEAVNTVPSSEPIFVTCDKHGGRDRYAAVLSHIFPEHRLEIIRESRPESLYRLHAAEQQLTFRFRSKGEQSLPTALASMSAKYLRELAMHAFNAFWLREVPGILPTAGYPLDAKRFWETIRPRQKALQIPDEVLWRER